MTEQGMQVVQVPAANGWRWVSEGLQIFRQNPLVWVAIFFAYLMITLALYVFLPLIGLILFYLIDPLFVAGFLIGCRAVEHGQDLELTHLFAAFKDRAARLVTIGGVNLVGRILIFGLMGLLFVNSGLSATLDLLERGDYAQLFASGIELQVVLWALILAVLMLPLYMAYWFSPALIEFDALEPFEAIRLSLKSCLTNFSAFLVFGLSFVAVLAGFFVVVFIIGGLLGTLTMMIGNGVAVKVFIGSLGLVLALLCWIGVQVLFTASQYMSYKDTFRSRDEVDGMMAL
jgi:hypothetical protein